MPGPASCTIILTLEHLEIVYRNLSKGKTEHRVATRSRILLLSHEGLGPTEIARCVGWTRQGVGKVRARYRQQGIEILEDASRSGRPRSISPPPTGDGGVARLHSA